MSRERRYNIKEIEKNLTLFQRIRLEVFFNWFIKNYGKLMSELSHE